MINNQAAHHAHAAANLTFPHDGQSPFVTIQPSKRVPTPPRRNWLAVFVAGMTDAGVSFGLKSSS